MTASRDRKEAAKRLGLTLQREYRELLTATGKDDIQATAIQLGDTFNKNLEFIVWVLKEFGGVQQMPFERQRSPSALPTPAFLSGQDT